MNIKVKVIQFGDSAAINLPTEALENLGAGIGDHVSVTESKHGIQLSPIDPELRFQMEVAEQIMTSNRTLLRKLAD